MRLFASPDFGASGMVALIVLVASALLFLVIAFAAGYTLRLLVAESTQQRRRGLWWGSCLAFAVLSPCFATWFFYYKPRADFERLLEGSDEVQITSLLIEGQGGEMVLDEAEAMTYLGDAFRSNSTDWYDLGTSYYVRIFLSTGGSVDCWVYLPDERYDPFRPASFTLGYPEGILDDRVRRCRISLPNRSRPKSPWC